MNLKKIVNNQIIKYLFIPILFLVFGLGLSILFNKTIPFSIIQENYSIHSISELPKDKLLKGGFIKGEFTARENYLGIVTLRFNDFIKVNYSLEDVLLFKIKQKEAKDWYYVNTYRTGILQNSLLIPFGFPITENSKNKIYEFQIESLAGNNDNSVELSKTEPVLITSHSFPKKEIFGSKQRIINYFLKKINNSILNLDFLLSSVVFFLPFLLYILFILSIKYSNFSKKLITYAPFLLVISDALLIRKFYIGIYLFLLIIWIVFLIRLKLKSKNTAIFLVVFFSLSVFLTIVNKRFSAERIDIWVYTLFIIEIAQIIKEENFFRIKNK